MALAATRTHRGDGPGSFGLGHVLLVALSLRLSVFVLAFLISPDGSGFSHPDTGSYLEPARMLAYHARFATARGPEIFRTPGYPLLLVPGIVLGQIVPLTILLQISLSCSTVYLIHRSALLLFGRADIARVGSFLYAVNPFPILYANKLISEAPFVFLAMLFVYQFLSYLQDQSRARLILSAMALCAAVYVRPLAYYLPLGIALLLMAQAFARDRQRPRLLLHAGIFLLVSASCIGLWHVRNVVTAGYPKFSTVQDYNLYYYNAAAVLAAGEGVSLMEMQDRLGLNDAELYFRFHPEQRDWPEGSRYQYMGREGLEVLKTHPLQYARIHLSGMLVLLANPNALEYLRLFGIPEGSRHWLGDVVLQKGFLRAAMTFLRERPGGFNASLILGLFLWSSLSLAAIGVFRLRPIRQPPLMAAGIVALYFFVLPGGPQTDPRYREPLTPFICIFAGYGLSVVVDRLRSSRGGPCPSVRPGG